MGSERSKYIMSVELAMRREIAYLREIEASQLEQSTVSEELSLFPTKAFEPGSSNVPRGPRPSSLPYPQSKTRQDTSHNLSRNPSPPSTSLLGPRAPSIRFPSPNPNPLSTSILGPRATLLRSPNPNPQSTSLLGPRTTSVRSPGPNPRPLSAPGQGTFQRPNSSHWGTTTLSPQHLQSRPYQASPIQNSVLGTPLQHTIQSPTLPLKRKLPPRSPTSYPTPSSNPNPAQSLISRPSPLVNRTDTSLKRKESPNEPPNVSNKMIKLFCEVCEVTCTSRSNLEMHLKGQKHKLKVKNNCEMNVDESTINSMLQCELCDIWCVNEFSFKQHLLGKSHINKVRDMEMMK